MQDLEDSVSLVFARKDSRMIIILATIFFLLTLLAFSNGGTALEALSFTSLPLLARLELFLSTFFSTSPFTGSSMLLAVLGSFFGAINLALAYVYMRLRGEVIIHSGLYSGLGLVVAFLGIGCAACGTAFLSVLLGFFGFSSMLNILPYKGEEVGYIGLFILLMATYSLARKVAAPNVC
jgi:hypothetical protein